MRSGFKKLATLACGAALVAGGCDKVVSLTEVLPPLDPIGLDATAGTWQMIELTGPTQFTVAAPTAPTSAAYLAELEALKTTQANLTAAQREIVAYWSGGGVMRWNQIIRELVARYNLPPAPRNDGGYPAPDAENPFGDPAFPFANPVYAARAYSYLSVAQYDALKSAWHWKYQFNRQSPANYDAAIQKLMPISALPSYPSEDAVISGVTADLLKVHFPAAVQEITLHAANQRNAALWSGKATPTDIAAGLALGKSIAAVFVTRGANDGLRNATGTAAQWQAMADAAIARGETPWKSQDLPSRPPMLPFFGNVRAWMMTPANIVTERPGPPPSTSSPQMAADLAEITQLSKNLTREQLRIAHYWNDGAGSYTPPGHWNDIALEYVRDARMSEVRAARAFALLNMAMHDAGVGCWDAKYFYFSPRPSQLDPSIKSPIGLPNFPAYTSGHSTFSAAGAAVMGHLFPTGKTSFDAMRDEAGLSRMYGGIHYRSDVDAGKAHGGRIAGYTITFAQGDGTPP